jgi:arylsulfatase A-like enzyme
MVLMPTADCRRVGYNQTDDRLVCLADVMPTLLDLCDIPIPPSVEGQSLLSDRRRDFLYAEHYEDEQAMRMVRSGRHKLIWYPAGNRFQLFDVQADPREMHDLAGQGEHQSVRAELTQRLVESLYGSDLEWVKDGQLVGCPAPPYAPKPYRSLANQRGWR